MNTSISVVIPAFNTADHLPATLDSIFAQTAPVKEVIVVDDGSTDTTPEVLKSYGRRIVHIEQQNGGAAAARNRGIAAATGNWIAFLDSDDAWLPEKTDWQLDVLRQFPDVVLVYGQMREVSANGEPAHTWPEVVCKQPSDTSLISAWAGLEQMPPTSTVLVRMDAIRQSGGFRRGLKIAEDLDLWIRLRTLGPFVGIDRVLADRHVRVGSLTHTYPPSFQYRRYLDVARNRRDEIQRWAGTEYHFGVASIHTSISLACLRERDRTGQLVHGIAALLSRNRSRRTAALLVAEGVLGERAYGYLRQALTRAKNPLFASSPKRPFVR